jgi:hypothetical protein
MATQLHSKIELCFFLSWGLDIDIVEARAPGEAGVDTTLCFESKFESGNLMQATQCADYEYDLMVCEGSTRPCLPSSLLFQCTFSFVLCVFEHIAARYD